MAFNVVMEIQTQVTGLTQAVQTINRSLGNVTANVNVVISQQSLQNLAVLNSRLTTLRSNLAAISSQTAATRGTFATIGAAFGPAAAAASNFASRVAGVTGPVRTVAAQMRVAADATEQFGVVMGLSARRFLAFSVATFAMVGLVRNFREGVSAAVEFERSMVKVAQVATTSLPSDIRRISDEITNLATNFGVSSSELAQGAVILKQAGFSAQETAAGLRVLADASLAPNFDGMAKTADGVIAVMRQFNLTSDETREAIGAMNAVAGAFAVEGRDLIEVVSKTGGAFKNAGGNVNELLALFTSVRATTRESAAEISTGLRTIFTRLQRPETVQALQDLNVELRYSKAEAEALGNVNLESQFVGTYEAVRRLAQGLSSVRTSDPRFSQIAEELGGYRQISRVIPLLQEFATAQKALSVAQAGGQSLTASTDKAQESLLVQTTKLKEEYLALGRAFVASDGFQSIARFALDAASSFGKWLEFLKPLIPLLTTLSTIKLAQAAISLAGGFAIGFAGGRSSVTPPGSPITRATGGPVPGVGHTDSVNAWLTPGEFVINKRAAESIGHANLQKMNDTGRAAYNRGGPVRQRLATGGQPRTWGEYLRGLFVEGAVALGGFLGQGDINEQAEHIERARQENQAKAVQTQAGQKRKFATGGLARLERGASRDAILGGLDKYLEGRQFSASGFPDVARSAVASGLTDEVLAHIPEGSQFLGVGLSAFAVRTPDGDVIRIQPAGARGRARSLGKSLDGSFFQTRRPGIGGVLQATASKRIGTGRGAVLLDRTPFAQDLNLPESDPGFQAIVRDMRKKLGGQGYLLQDTHPGNFGLLNGEVVVRDPGSVTKAPAKLFASTAVEPTPSSTPATERLRRVTGGHVPLPPHLVGNNPVTLGLSQFNEPQRLNTLSIANVGLGRRITQLRALTVGEEKALVEYTKNEYGTVNSALRGGFDPLPEEVDLFKLIQSGVGASVLTGKLPLYRGLSKGGVSRLSELLGGHLGSNEVIGKDFTEPGYLSTSVDRGVAEKFTNKGGVTLGVIPKLGGRAANLYGLSNFSSEREVLLDKGQKFRVVGQHNGVVVVKQLAAGGVVNKILDGLGDANAATNANVGLAGYTQQRRALTRGEVASVRDYAEGSGYINSRLRGVDLPPGLPQDEVAEYLADIRRRYGGLGQLDQVIKHLDSAVGSGTVAGGVTAFRGLVNAGPVVSQLGVPLDSREAIGKEFGDAGFLSTSVSRDRTAAWSRQGLLQLLLKEGTPGIYLGNASGGVGDVSRNHVEQELLLGRGSRFRIVGRDSGLLTAQQLNRGGSISGEGNTDKVPALLTPGEFVFNKDAVAQIGMARLHQMNTRGYNRGGFVHRLADGSNEPVPEPGRSGTPIGGAAQNAAGAVSQLGEAAKKTTSLLDRLRQKQAEKGIDTRVDQTNVQAVSSDKVIRQGVVEDNLDAIQRVREKQAAKRASKVVEDDTAEKERIKQAQQAEGRSVSLEYGKLPTVIKKLEDGTEVDTGKLTPEAEERTRQNAAFVESARIKKALNYAAFKAGGRKGNKDSDEVEDIGQQAKLSASATFDLKKVPGFEKFSGDVAALPATGAGSRAAAQRAFEQHFFKAFKDQRQAYYRQKKKSAVIGAGSLTESGSSGDSERSTASLEELIADKRQTDPVQLAAINAGEKDAVDPALRKAGGKLVAVNEDRLGSAVGGEQARQRADLAAVMEELKRTKAPEKFAKIQERLDKGDVPAEVAKLIARRRGVDTERSLAGTVANLAADSESRIARDAGLGGGRRKPPTGGGDVVAGGSEDPKKPQKLTAKEIAAQKERDEIDRYQRAQLAAAARRDQLAAAQARRQAAGTGEFNIIGNAVKQAQRADNKPEQFRFTEEELKQVAARNQADRQARLAQIRESRQNAIDPASAEYQRRALGQPGGPLVGPPTELELVQAEFQRSQQSRTRRTGRSLSDGTFESYLLSQSPQDAAATEALRKDIERRAAQRTPIDDRLGFASVGPDGRRHARRIGAQGHVPGNFVGPLADPQAEAARQQRAHQERLIKLGLATRGQELKEALAPGLDATTTAARQVGEAATFAGTTGGVLPDKDRKAAGTSVPAQGTGATALDQTITRRVVLQARGVSLEQEADLPRKRAAEKDAKQREFDQKIALARVQQASQQEAQRKQAAEELAKNNAVRAGGRFGFGQKLGLDAVPVGSEDANLTLSPNRRLPALLAREFDPEKDKARKEFEHLASLKELRLRGEAQAARESRKAEYEAGLVGPQLPVPTSGLNLDGTPYESDQELQRRRAEEFARRKAAAAKKAFSGSALESGLAAEQRSRDAALAERRAASQQEFRTASDDIARANYNADSTTPRLAPGTDLSTLTRRQRAAEFARRREEARVAAERRAAEATPTPAPQTGPLGAAESVAAEAALAADHARIREEFRARRAAGNRELTHYRDRSVSEKASLNQAQATQAERDRLGQTPGVPADPAAVARAEARRQRDRDARRNNLPPADVVSQAQRDGSTTPEVRRELARLIGGGSQLDVKQAALNAARAGELGEADVAQLRGRLSPAQLAQIEKARQQSQVERGGPPVPLTEQSRNAVGQAEQRNAAAQYNAARNAAQGTQRGFNELVEQRANASTESQLASRRRSGPVSQTTRNAVLLDELNAQQAAVKRQLIEAERRLIQAIHPNISALERDRLAEENVANAMNGLAKVVTDQQGRQLGTAATVAAAQAAGVNTAATGPAFNPNAPASSWLTRAYRKVSDGLGQANAAVGQVTSRIPAGVGTGALIGLPLLSGAVAGAGGTAENAVATGTENNTFGFKSAQALAGALQGGVVGATVGAAFGPLGAVVGSVAGTLGGLVTSFIQAGSEIRQAKIHKALDSFADKLQSLITDGPNASNDVVVAARRDLRTIGNNTSTENIRNATGYFTSFDPAKYAGLQEKSTREQFSGRLPQLTQLLNNEAERQVKKTPTATTDQVFNNIVNSNDGFNREMVRFIANIRQLPLEAVERELRKNIEAFRRTNSAERTQLEARKGVEGSVNAFGRLLASLQSASDAADKLTIRSQQLSDAFEGVVGSSRVTTNADKLTQLGRPDQGAFEPLQTIAAATGESGQRLLSVGQATDTIAAVLPTVLAQVASKNFSGPSAEQDLATDITNRLRDATGPGRSKDVEAVIANVTRNINEATQQKGVLGVTSEVTVDVTKFAEKLLAQFAEPLKDVGGRAAKLIEDNANRYADGLTRARQQLVAIGDGLDRVVAIGTARQRAAADVAADRGSFRNAGSISTLSVAELSRPFTARQERLTGLGGAAALDPGVIANALAQANRDVREADGRKQAAFRETGGRGPAFTAAADELFRLKDRAANLQQALKNLADATQQNAVVQEKLAKIDEDRTSRLSFGERFIGSDFEQRNQTLRGVVLANQASQAGNLNGFLPQDQKLIIDTLRGFGGATLTGFTGAPRADDLVEKLVKNTFGGVFGLDAGKQGEKDNLQRQLLDNFKKAEEAQKLLVANQQTLHNDFFANLKTQQAEFFQRLEQFLQQDKLQGLQREQGALAKDQTRLAGQKKNAEILTQLGVTRDDQVPAARQAGKAVNEFAAARTRVIDIQRREAGGQTQASDILADARKAATDETGTSGFTIQRINNTTGGRFLSTLAINDDAKAKLADQLKNRGFTPAEQGRILADFQQDYKNRSDANVYDNAGMKQFEDIWKNKGGQAAEQFIAERVNRQAAESLRAAIEKENGKALNDAQKDVQEKAKGVRQAGLDDKGLAIALGAKNENLPRVVEALTAFDGAANRLGALKDSIEAANQKFKELGDRIAELQKQLANPGGVPAPAPGFAEGGNIFAPRGTDTVPAMLTPGEFVVNRRSAQANLHTLRRINEARGPAYLADGGGVTAEDIAADIAESRKRAKEREEALAAARAGAVSDTPENRDVAAARAANEARAAARAAKEPLPTDANRDIAAFRNRVVLPVAAPQRDADIAAFRDREAVRPADRAVPDTPENRDVAAARAANAARAEARAAGQPLANQANADIAAFRARVVVPVEAPQRDADIAAFRAKQEARQGLPQKQREAPVPKVPAPAKKPVEKTPQEQLDEEVLRQAALNPNGRSGLALQRFNLIQALNKKRRGKEEDNVKLANRLTDAAQTRANYQNLARRQAQSQVGQGSLAGFGLSRPGAQGQLFDAALARQQAENNKSLRENLSLDKVRRDRLNANRVPGLGPPRVGFATGGVVPGYFSGGDTVPAALTPGEFVVNRDAAIANMPLLRDINSGRVQHFADGGPVAKRLVDDMVVNFSDVAKTQSPAGNNDEVVQAMQRLSQQLAQFATTAVTFGKDMNNLARAFDGFGTTATRLAEAMTAFPHTLTMNGSYRVEHVVNGAEVLTRILPELKVIVEDSIKAKLNEVFKANLPEIGLNLE